MKDGQPELKELDRRRFLCLLAGSGILSGSLESAVEAAAGPGSFFFADLKTGQIGFPCGLSIPAGRPGSIMKLVAAAALIDGRLLAPEKEFECRGVLRLNKETYNCQFAHGRLDLVHAIGMSCNIYFAQASRRLSVSTILDYAERFGLNRPVAGFAGGRFPSAGGVRAPGSENSSQPYVLGLSDDLQPTALQILRLAALVGGCGKLSCLGCQPSVHPGGGSFELVLANLSWQVLRQGMHIAARQGTGRKLDPRDTLKLAIKTGTTPRGKNFESWLAGFFPYEAPRYAFVYRAPAGTGQDRAVPEARSFLFSAKWPL
jgi:penicillin-binding protein 2